MVRKIRGGGNYASKYGIFLVIASGTNCSFPSKRASVFFLMVFIIARSNPSQLCRKQS